MIEVQLGKKSIPLKETLTVKQYQEIQVQQLFNKKATPSKLLSIYLEVDEKEIKNASKEQIAIIEKFVFNRLTKNVDNQIVFTFEQDGIIYGFENDWKKLAWGAWQDIEFLTTDDTTKNIHRILSILYRPVIEEKGTKYKIEPYDSETIEDRAERFKELPITIWFGCAQLFFYIGSEYTTSIKNTLEQKMKIYKMMQTGKKIVPKWLQKKLSLDSILQQHLSSLETILPK